MGLQIHWLTLQLISLVNNRCVLTDSLVRLGNPSRSSFTIRFGKESKKYTLRNEKCHIIFILQLLFTFDSETDYTATVPMANPPV